MDSEPALEFQLEEDEPTLPQRARSGTSIKGAVVRAMQLQLDAEKDASQALDEMIRSLRKAESIAPPLAPPRPDGRYRGNGKLKG